MTKTTRIAVAVAAMLGFTVSASAQTLRPAVESLNAVNGLLGPLADITLTFGSDNDQDPGDEDAAAPCPGFVPGGNDDELVYDWNLDSVPDYAQILLLDALAFGSTTTAPGRDPVTVTQSATVNAAVNEIFTVIDTETIDVAALISELLKQADPTLRELLLDPTLQPLLLSALGDDAAPLADFLPLDDLPTANANLDLVISGLAFFAGLEFNNISDTACFLAADDAALLIGILGPYEVALTASATPLETFVGANRVLDDDETILDKWAAAAAAFDPTGPQPGSKTDATADTAFLDAVEAFIVDAAAAGAGSTPGAPPAADPDNTPFPPAPNGSPVGAPLGIGLAALAVAVGGAFAARRK